MGFNILIADDHRILRESLRRVLEDEPDMKVIAEAQDGSEAVNMAKKTKPDVILMDISMPKLNGIEAARKILREQPSTKILILSMHSNKQFIEDAFQAGIRGYLLKNCAISEVVSAIHVLENGQYYISPDIAGVVIEDFIQFTPAKSDTDPNVLSNREKEILQHIANGETTKKISQSLYVSEKTVETHRKHIMKKLHCSNLAELIKQSIRKGYISIVEE